MCQTSTFLSNPHTALLIIPSCCSCSLCLSLSLKLTHSLCLPFYPPFCFLYVEPTFSVRSINHLCCPTGYSSLHVLALFYTDLKWFAFCGWLVEARRPGTASRSYLSAGSTVDKDRKAEAGIVAVNLYSEICLVPSEETERKQIIGYEPYPGFDHIWGMMFACTR